MVNNKKYFLFVTKMATKSQQSAFESLSCARDKHCPKIDKIGFLLLLPFVLIIKENRGLRSLIRSVKHTIFMLFFRFLLFFF